MIKTLNHKRQDFLAQALFDDLQVEQLPAGGCSREALKKPSWRLKIEKTAKYDKQRSESH